MGSIMGAEDGRRQYTDGAPEISAAHVPPSLTFEVVDGLIANHARHHSEAGVPKGSCHADRYHTE